MDWTRSARIVGAGTAFAVLVAWMIPPTTPKPPEQAARRSAAKADQGASPELDRFASGAAPASRDRSPAVQTDEPLRHSAQPAWAPSRMSTIDADRSTQDENESAPALVINHRYSDDDDRYADDDVGDQDRYRSGYSWAADMQIQDPRECRRWRGDSGEDGCLDFLREQYDRDDRERWAGN